MSVGLEIKVPTGLGNSFRVQLDETYENYEVIKRGSYINSGNFAKGFTRIYYEGSADRTNLVFIRAPLNVWFCNYEPVLIGGGSMTDAYPGTGSFSVNCPAGTQIEYVVCSRIAKPVSDTFGLEIRDATGRQVFHSGKDYMKIKVVRWTTPQGPSSQVWFPPNSIAYSPVEPGRKLYVLLNTLNTKKIYTDGDKFITEGMAACIAQLSPDTPGVRYRENHRMSEQPYDGPGLFLNGKLADARYTIGEM